MHTKSERGQPVCPRRSSHLPSQCLHRQRRIHRLGPETPQSGVVASWTPNLRLIKTNATENPQPQTGPSQSQRIKSASRCARLVVGLKEGPRPLTNGCRATCQEPGIGGWKLRIHDKDGKESEKRYGSSRSCVRKGTDWEAQRGSVPASPPTIHATVNLRLDACSKYDLSFLNASRMSRKCHPGSWLLSHPPLRAGVKAGRWGRQFQKRQGGGHAARARLCSAERER
jgi:hypothetical protein